MSLVAAAAAGGAFGVRHALETDHLAAIAALVDGERSPALTGASWGLGHTLPIAALGLLFLVLGLRLPETVTLAVEGAVAVVLVALGVRMLLRTTDVIGVEAHSHDGTGRSHHHHLRLGTLSLGRHLHLDGDSAAVGVLHGVAGSGALIVAMVAGYASTTGALAFLAAFGVGSTLTMAGVSLAWGRSQGAGFENALRVVGGLVGVVVGALLLAEVLGLGLPAVPSLPFLH